MSKNKSLVNQIVTELIKMCRFGHSKHKARIDEKTRNPQGIFSVKTYETYKGLCKTFGKWASATHHCRKLSEAAQYVPEYLCMMIDKNDSPWTVHTYASALAKLFKVKSSDFGVKLPPRERRLITRSRSPADPKTEADYSDLFEFIKGCGLRPHEIRMVKGEDVYKDGDKVYVIVRNGKGGKKRTVTVLPEYAGHILKMAGSVEPKDRIFSKTPADGHMHYYRGWFAKELYKRLARPVDKIPKKEKYIMRKDRAGEVLDRVAMLKVSIQLGHNRIDVIAGNYLYDLCAH